MNGAPLIGLPRKPGLGWVAALGDAATGLGTLDRLYRTTPQGLRPAEFIRHALDTLQIDYELARGSVESVPAEGPLLVVANHPYGAAEGLAIADLLLRRRSDLKILANGLLRQLPELAPLIIPIDVFRNGVNAGGLRSAVRHLRAGGALLTFPAGEVSRLDWSMREIADPVWPDTSARIAEHSGARILPIHVGGRPHLGSVAAGLINTRLRTALLARDLLRLRGHRLSFSLGEAMPAAELRRLPQAARIGYLRLATYALGGAAAKPTLAPARQEPIAIAAAPAALAAAVAALPPQRRLLSHQDLDLYLAPAAEMPILLDEIGRLRELSFRAVEEGSGLARDTDRFDAHYEHLFLWHGPSCQIVGAYRLGYTDQLLPRLGVGGLYTHTLFDYDRSLFEATGPALELGRSFVVPDWQRSFHPLRLLWAGIATVMARNPQLRCLFGPVSISPSYSPAGRQLMAAALVQHHSDPVLSARVRPRHPHSTARVPAVQRQVISALADPQLLSRLIARIEQGPGLPVLLRHYLEINGRFAGFNVDHSFGGTLDGLVFVEVERIPAKVMARYTLTDKTPPQARS